jgi:carboxyl-terminal processing protease
LNKNKYIPIWISFAAAVGIIIGSQLNFNGMDGFFASNSQEKKIKTLINYINNDYVDEVNTDSLLNNAIESIVGSLDPHSVYISPDELQQINDTMEGSFVGIGVQFMIMQDTLNVTKIIQGGPSEKAGLLAGDRILKADNTVLYGDSLSNTLIKKSLKGEKGTTVALQIYRKRNDSLFTINLKRGKVKLPSIDVAYMLNDTLGYIKINRFSNTTYNEFMQGLHKLENQNLQALVLDLRGNTGGYLHTTEAIVDEFLGDDKLIVFTKNKRKVIDKSFATAKGEFEQGKLFVLIDEDSASASEILAGAIQDNDRGTIVGRRSFGKGLVQQQMELGDGSAVRLTTSRYYTPTGRSIQKPYIKGHKDEYYKEAIKRNYSGELLSKDSIKVVDSLKFTTPKGKIVYGGGGIIPDVFVPLDQKGLHGISALMQYNLLNSFIYNYIDKNRNRLANVTMDEFVTNDDIGSEIVHYFEKELTHKNLNTHFKLGKNPILVRFIKALVARQLYGNEAYYKIISQDDNVLQKVLELN